MRVRDEKYDFEKDVQDVQYMICDQSCVVRAGLTPENTSNVWSAVRKAVIDSGVGVD